MNGPFFIVGAPRSGTTLLSLMLDSHPRVAIPYESHLFIDYHQRQTAIEAQLSSAEGRRAVIQNILDHRYVREWDWTPSLRDIDLERCGTVPSCIDQVFTAYARHHGKQIWADKTPSYLLHINVLNDFFPASKFIHLVRDGRDVAMSLLGQPFGPRDLLGAILRWKEFVYVGRKMLSMLPRSRVLEVRLEDLASSAELTLRTVCDFLQIEYCPERLFAYQEKAELKVGNRITGRHDGLTEPVSVDRVTRWKESMAEVDQAIAWELAGPLLEELGYERGRTEHSARILRKVYYWIREAVRYRVESASSHSASTRSAPSTFGTTH